MFEPATWPGAPVAPGYSGGRGATLFIERGGQRWVLRHYHRGGTIGRVLDDQFLWLGEERTRCFREWRLLAHLQDLGLPAPRPVAARYRRRGLTYTADLLTVLIPDVEPLSTRLARGPVAPDVWAAVGRCISDFHRGRRVPRGPHRPQPADRFGRTASSCWTSTGAGSAATAATGARRIWRACTGR